MTWYKTVIDNRWWFLKPQEKKFNVNSSIYLTWFSSPRSKDVCVGHTSAILQTKQRYSDGRLFYGEAPRVFRFLFPGSFWADDLLHGKFVAKFVFAGPEQVHKVGILWLVGGQGAWLWLAENWSQICMGNHLIKLDSLNGFRRSFATKRAFSKQWGLSMCVFVTLFKQEQ